MSKITDKKGREWSIEIDLVTIRRVRKGLDINLLELVVPDSDLPLVLSDPVTLGDVLYVLCSDQATDRGVSDEDFGRALSPESLEAATIAIMEGVVNFSPPPLRPALQKALEKAKRFEADQKKKAKLMMESQEFDAMLEEAVEKSFVVPENSPTESIGDVGNSPELSESSPDETPTQP